MFLDSQFWCSFRVKTLSLETKEIPEISISAPFHALETKNGCKCPQNTVLHEVFPAHVRIQGAQDASCESDWQQTRPKKQMSQLATLCQQKHQTTLKHGSWETIFSRRGYVNLKFLLPACSGRIAYPSQIYNMCPIPWTKIQDVH